MNFIESQEWRYATKKFDPSKKVSDSDFEKIKRGIQLAASSYGIQAYTVLNVEDAELRQKLQPASWGQPQIVDASHLLVFCNYTDVSEDYLDGYAELKSSTQQIPKADAQGFADYIKKTVKSMSPEQIETWTAKQVYIALGNALAACADLQIDACPMEGFDKDQYNELLGLKEKGLTACVVMTLGYRSAEDATQHLAKVRKPVEALFETV